jgi:EAL domain-containing protein (putative c-di-GMP-specific phosphodiesterase class I)
VVEVHETAVMEVDQDACELAARLTGIGVQFCLRRLRRRPGPAGRDSATCRPYVVKFDMGLIRGIHDRRPEGKQRVVRDLVRLVLQLRSVPLAEGVETGTGSRGLPRDGL